MKKYKGLLFAILLIVLLFCACIPAEIDLVETQNLIANESMEAVPSTSEAPIQQNMDADPPGGQSETVVADDSLPAGPIENSFFEVHYIDVAQGDAALVLCDREAMLIDGGESNQSSKIYAYLKKHGVSHLNYIVASHAHSDHTGGLSGALNYATVDAALCPVTEYDSEIFGDFVKYLDQQGVSITVPEPDQTYTLGSAVVTVLGPRHAHEEANDTSLVMRIDYGTTSFLFTGDAERPAELDVLEAGCELSATVLKVGHHGSETSTIYPFLREIMPEYAVVSVGKDNPYGHPTEDVMSRLRDADVQVYRTDLQGTIICTSDGQTVSFQTERNESAQTNPTIVSEETIPEEDSEQTDAGAYIGNKNSKKFHLPTCGTLPTEKNRIYLDSRQQAMEKGFIPCKNCDP